MLARREVTVDTRFGSIRMKVSEGAGIHRVKPEFEDCRRLAGERNVTIVEVHDAALDAFRAQEQQ